MADAPIAPWGPRTGEPAVQPAPAPAAVAAAAAGWNTIIWGTISTLILAAWIGLAAGPMAALALVGGVFVHEYGHVLVINWAGAGPSSIRIIPFLGGAATMRRAPDSDFKGVLIALAGPAFGLLAALPFVIATLATGDRAWLAGAFYVGALNLINLAPAAPLDGAKAIGPALARIHPWLERGVLMVIAALALYWAFERGSFLFGAVIAFGALRAFMATRIRPPARLLTVGEWAASVGLYLAVVAACAAVALWSAQAGHITLQLFSLGGHR